MGEIKPVMITGATGLLGSNIAIRFRKEGVPTIPVGRRAQGKSVVSLDLRDREKVEELCREVGSIIHCAYDDKGPPQENLEIAKNIIAAAEKHEIRQVILVSTYNVSLPLHNTYSRVKKEIEELFADSVKETVVVRPTVIYGKDCKQLEGYVKSIEKFSAICLFSQGKFRIQPIWVEDLAEAIYKIERKGKIVQGRVYTLAGPSALTYRAVVEKIGAIMGKKVLFLSIPAFLPLFVGKLLKGRFGTARKIYEKMLTYPFDKVALNGQTEEVLGRKAVEPERMIKKFLRLPEKDL